MAQSPFISAQSFKLGNHKRGRSCDCRRPCTRLGCAGILSLLMEEQGNARLSGCYADASFRFRKFQFDIAASLDLKTDEVWLSAMNSFQLRK
jgi:hypothetical protein